MIFKTLVEVKCLHCDELLNWRPFNISVIFQPICFKIEYEVVRRMRNYEATPPQRYGTVRGAGAPFPAAPPTNGAGSITLSFFSRFASNSGVR